MKKIIFVSLFTLLPIYAKADLEHSELVSSLDKFVPSLLILDDLVESMSDSDHESLNGFKDSHFKRAIALNSYLREEFVYDEIELFFCEKQKKPSIGFIKWEIVTKFGTEKLNEAGILCNEMIDEVKGILNDLLEKDNRDIDLRYYKYVKNNESDNFPLQKSLISANLYFSFDVVLAEDLIDLYKSRGFKKEAFNFSLLAAKYGSEKGIDNVLQILKALNIPCYEEFDLYRKTLKTINKHKGTTS